MTTPVKPDLDLLTVPQMAVILRLSPVRVRKICQAGRLGRRIGNQYFATREQVEAFAAIPRETGNPNWKARRKSL